MHLRRHGLLAVVLSAALVALSLLASMASALAEGDAPYYIEVDVGNQIVTIYDAATMDIVRQMLCSTGQKLHWTPVGDYILPENEKSTDRGPWYQIGGFFVRYATRLSGKVLFHSIPYNWKDEDCIDRECLRRFGTPASHGCIRLRWQDAKFIAEKCLPGTRVKVIYNETRDEELRALLYQESFDASKGFSYESFLGVSDQPDVLDRHSRGQAVADLQLRLRDLGIYDGELGEVYDSATVNAVRYAQFLLGTDPTGLADPEFVEAIFADDAPTAMKVRLETGMSGPAVKRLQANLKALRLYDDALDSVYDAGVVEGVRQFQRVYGYEVDGAAGPTVQKAVAYEAGRLAVVFGDSDYSCRWTGEPMILATVNASAGVKLRQSASLKSPQLQRLPENRRVIVLKHGSGWSKVSSDGEVGYVYNDLVTFASQMVGQLSYTSAAGDRSYAVGYSAGDYKAGADLPCNVFEDYLAANDTQSDVSSLGAFVTVDTGEGDAPLNLRAAPDSDSPVLTTVENGINLRAERRTSEWTQVTYGGQSGYLMNRYLMYWAGPKDALEKKSDAGKARSAFSGYAKVQSANEEQAAVYEDDLAEAKVLGHLADGTMVEVLETVNGWCHIRYMGHEGYMVGEDLEFDDSLLKAQEDADGGLS